MLRRACLATVVLALAALAAAAPGAVAQSRIVGGKPATSYAPELTSAVVALGDDTYRSAHAGAFCTGVLVAPLVVITARHCVENPPYLLPPTRIVVMRGWDGLRTLPTRGWDVDKAQVASIHRSPALPTVAYDRGADIAVLRLASALQTAAPAAVAQPGDDAWWGGTGGRAQGVFAAGWGSTKDANAQTGALPGPMSTTLQVVELPIVAAARCAARSARPAISRRHICAGVLRTIQGGQARTACYGDSGGPLFAADPAATTAPTDPATPRKVVALTAYGEEYACGDGYGHYTRVDKHFAWINGFVERDLHALPTVVPPSGVRVTGSGRVSLAFDDPVGAVPAARRIVLVVPFANQVVELTRMPGGGGAVALPPSRSGILKLRVRSVDAGGVESASGDTVTARTDRDRVAPRIASFRATALGRGRWKLAWSRPVETDRVIAIGIQKRRAGTRRWVFEHVIECPVCWSNGAARIENVSLHEALPGRWQFRISALDRAGNYGRWTVAR